MLYSYRLPTIQWRSPRPPRRPILQQVVAFITRASPPAPASLHAAVREFGLPAIPGVSPEDELIGLLRCAAAVEHGLMAQYLYAAYSARDGGVRAKLLEVAVQEMGHLFTVENVLVGCGAEVSLWRYDWIDQFPFAPFPFHLEPISRETLAKYAVSEMPAEASVDDEEADIIEEMRRFAKGSAGDAPLMVGLLYLKIYWLLRPDDGPPAVPSSELWPNYPHAAVLAEVGPDRHVSTFPTIDPAAQGQREHWSRYQGKLFLAREVPDRTAALAGIADISAQGEGVGSTPEGHFDAFAALFRASKAGGVMSHPVPVDPWHEGSARQGRPDSKISAASTAALARAADGMYELCLLAVALYFTLPRDTFAEARGRLGIATQNLMMGGLRDAADQLVTMGALDENNANGSGALCLGRPPVEPPAAYAALRERALEVAAGVQAICDGLTSDPDVLLAVAAEGIRDSAVIPFRGLLEGLPAQLP